MLLETYRVGQRVLWRHVNVLLAEQIRDPVVGSTKVAGSIVTASDVVAERLCTARGVVTTCMLALTAP